MAYTPTNNLLGIQPIAQTNTPLPSQYQVGQSQAFGQAEPLGKIVEAYDPNYGAGEFIYLIGTTGTVTGSVVTWGGVTSGVPQYQTSLASTSSVSGSPIAVSMSANIAGQYGWYQISGMAVATVTGSVVTGTAFVSATSGSLSTTGTVVVAANVVAAAGTPSTGFCVVEIGRPSLLD